MNLTAEYVRERLDYDPETGEFKFKPKVVRQPWDKSWNSRRAGTRAGAINSEGYVEIFLDTRSYKAHRLAWLYVHGEWPDQLIDHIDRCRSNNRISNLRIASDVQNKWNTGLLKSNKSGCAGVLFRDGKWIARIKANRKAIFLGNFASKDDAISARRAAELRYHGEFSPLSAE